MRQTLGGHERLSDDWTSTATVMREAGREVFGVSSGQRTDNKGTWLGNEDVQEINQRKVGEEEMRW